jgi:Domain of unknown function (DUF4864)
MPHRNRLAALVAAFIWLLTTPLAAQQRIDLPASDRAAIQAIITDQIAAFRRDDGTSAFGLASPMIQSMFQSPETFMEMVRGGYQPVYRPREVTFKDMIDFRGQPTQTVLVVGPDGVPVMALYQMQRQPDGSWLINGCTLLKIEDKSV